MFNARSFGCSVGAACLLAGVACAGPPFLTDDPEPTDTGHWEIYAPYAEASGRGLQFDGAVGAELNYGALPNVQVTVGLPVSFSHSDSGWRFGRGDIDLSVKYRFFHSEKAGLSIAVFPGLSLPTARSGFGNSKVTAFLPVWVQKDMGPWSVFGGGGYALNPGPGNRDYWSGGVAVTRQLSQRLVLGVEVDPQGADTVDGKSSVSLGAGGILNLTGPFRLLGSVGPTFTYGQAGCGFHAFMALGLDF